MSRYILYKFKQKGEMKMEFVEKIKKEPRVLLAIIGVVCLFLPLFSVRGEASVGEYVVGSFGEGAITLMDMLDASIIWGLLYPVAIGQALLPLLKNDNLQKKLFLVLPIVAVLLLGGCYLNADSFSMSMDYDVYATASVKVGVTIAFWILILCNMAIFIWTCVKDFNIKNKEDLKESLQNLNMEDISKQATETIHELGTAVSSIGAVECPNCHDKVRAGKKFCPHCGNAMPEKENVKEVVVCESCGKKLETGAKFCPECGTAVQEKQEPEKVICSECGKEAGVEEKFCSQCGNKLGGGE